MKYLKLLRVKQYVKNLFIFIPTFFAGEIFMLDKLWALFIAFFAFSFMASTIYILNDIKDVEEDREHPTKRNRPIASGAISKKTALFILPICFLTSLGLAYFLQSKEVFVLLLSYFVLNLAYTFYLKKIAILDIVLVASFFLLRLFVGGFATGIILSKWIVLMVFLLALGLVLGKRYDDLLLYEADNTKKLRKALEGYNLEFTKLATLSVFIIATISYIMYSVSADVEGRLHSQYVYLTSIPVIVGVLRYLNIMLVEKGSGSPTDVLLKDRFTQINLLIWLLILSFLYYV